MFLGMAAPIVPRASDILKIEYDGETYEKKAPFVIAELDTLAKDQQAYGLAWSHLIGELDKLKPVVPKAVAAQNALRRAHGNVDDVKTPINGTFAKQMSQTQWDLGWGLCIVKLQNMLKERNILFGALVRAVHEIKKYTAADAGGQEPHADGIAQVPAVDTLVGGADDDTLLLDLLHTMSGDEGSSGGSHRSSASASSGGDTAAASGGGSPNGDVTSSTPPPVQDSAAVAGEGGSPAVDAGGSLVPPVQNGAAEGAAASALAVVHASHTQDPATMDPAELAAMRAEIRAELTQTRQIREELAQTKSKYEKQVADLQKQLDVENQKRLEGDKLIAQLRLEPDRVQILKDQHRMAMNAVEKERDALKEQMTKMNGQDMLDALQKSLGDRLTKAGGSYTTAVQNLVNFEIAVMAAFGDQLPTGDEPPSVEKAAAQVQKDQVTLQAMWDAIGIERVLVTGKGSDAIKKLVAIEEAFIGGFHVKAGDDVLGKVNECAGQYEEYLIMKADEDANEGVSMASMKEVLEQLKRENVTLSQQYQDAVKKVTELAKSDVMVQHILSKDEWTGIVDVDPFCDRVDALLEILKQSREASGAASNEMIADSVRNLRIEKDQLEGVIDKFKADMAKLPNDPSQLGAEVSKLKSTNLDLEKTIATSSTEISNLKGELVTSNSKFQKCEHELIQCQSKLGAAEHNVDSYNTRYQDDQHKITDLERRNAALLASQTSTGRRAPSGSSTFVPSPTELDDVVSSLLRQFRLLARPAGGTSTNEKAQGIAAVINKVLDTISNQNVKVEACRMIVRRLNLTLGGRAELSLDIAEDLNALKRLSHSSP